MRKFYRPAIYMEEDWELKLKSFANERNLSINNLFINMADEYIARYSSDYDLTENLKRNFRLLESNLTFRPKKKEYKNSLKNYIYNKYNQESQRYRLYSKLIFNQIYAEWRFLHLLFNKEESYQVFNLTYSDYYKKANECKQNHDLLYKEFENKFLQFWFFELKQRNIIESVDDLNKGNFKYQPLERFVFKLCKYKQIKNSINIIKELQNVNQRIKLAKLELSASRLTIKTEILKKFDVFMKIMLQGGVKDFNFDFLKFEPFILFTKVLELEKFIEFLEYNGPELDEWIRIFKDYFDEHAIPYKIIELDSSIEESYRNLINFTNILSEIYRIVKYKTNFVPNHFKLEKNTPRLLNDSFDRYKLLREILISVNFDEIDYYITELNKIFN